VLEDRLMEPAGSSHTICRFFICSSVEHEEGRYCRSS
jgi:hypothetical protein